MERFYPPIEYIGLGGATNFALLISWPIHFSCTFRRITAAVPRADFIVGGVTVIGGLCGTFAGGYLADWAFSRFKHGQLWLCALSSLAGIIPTERILTIARSANRLLALFPFEPPLYKDAGIEVTYVGHPLAHDAATQGSRRSAREQLKIPIAQPVFALLPGSRQSELDAHSDLVLRTAAAIHAQKPDAFFLVPLATRPTRDKFETDRFRLGLDTLPMTLLYGHARDALEAADVALVASGTATLEAALARCPHIVFYRVKALTEWYVRRKYLLPYVGLPNILAGRFVVPEFLQNEATVDTLTQAAVNLYDDTVTRRRLEALFGGFAERLDVDTAALASDAVIAELSMVR